MSKFFIKITIYNALISPGNNSETNFFVKVKKQSFAKIQALLLTITSVFQKTASNMLYLENIRQGTLTWDLFSRQVAIINKSELFIQINHFIKSIIH